MVKTENILGYIGATLLSIRFIPIIYNQVKTDKKLFNDWFCLLEILSCIFLGSSAYMYLAYPFIICNTIALISTVTVMLIYYLKKCRQTETSET